MRRNTVLFAVALMAVGAMFSIGQDAEQEQKRIVTEKWFVIRIDGKSAGYVHTTRKPSGDPSAPILFEYERLIDSEKTKVSLNVQTYCEDNNYYYPARATAKIRQPNEVSATFAIAVEKKIPYGCSKSKMKVVYRRGYEEHKVDRDFPEHTVTEVTLLEIISHFPD